MMKPLHIHTANPPGLSQAVPLLYVMVLFILISGFASFEGNAQSTTISINATATVIDQKEIELITLNHLTIDETMADNGIIFVSSKDNPSAGKLMVKGMAGDEVRISFQRELVLTNSEGTGTLIFSYNISGFGSDNQRAAELYTTGEQKITLNEQGVFYLWVGGRIDISTAAPGQYDGEFTIEIEYVE